MYDGFTATGVNPSLKRTMQLSGLLVDIKTVVTRKTGEEQLVGFYKGIEFTLCNNDRINLKGSFHKMLNNGLHNHNDFSISDAKNVLNELVEKFGSDILDLKLNSIEMGLNITLPWTAADFVRRRNIIMLKYGVTLKSEIVADDKKGFDKGLKYILTDYMLKVYDKGLQYNVANNLLRCEIKSRLMRHLNDAGISSIGDIMRPGSVDFLFKQLIDHFNSILIREDLKSDAEIPEAKRNFWALADNPDWWNDYKKFNPVKRKREKDKFYRFLEKYAVTDYKGKTIELLNAKYQILRL